MKKVIASVVAVGCLAAAGSAFAGLNAGTGVNGSLHDMTKVSPSTVDKMARVCVYCHAPHHAIKDAAADNYPLWNHELVSLQGYVGYTWATPANAAFDGVDQIVNPLMGPSRLCMSCHDGAIAIDQHGDAANNGTFAQNPGTIVAARAKLTNDLSNTHPIGFDYNNIASKRNAAASNGSATAGGATEIVPSTYGFAVSITESTTPGVYNNVVRAGADGKAFKPIKDTLYQGTYMTCATCHEVHNKENAKQADFADGSTYTIPTTGETVSAPNYFLYAKEEKSLICLSCHVK